MLVQPKYSNTIQMLQRGFSQTGRWDDKRQKGFKQVIYVLWPLESTAWAQELKTEGDIVLS